MKKQLIIAIYILIAGQCLLAQKIDSVAAVVDGYVITMSELQAVTTNTKMPLKDSLERMIIEKLVEIEAQSKGISVTDNEVERYLTQVADKNGLTQEGLDNELKKAGRDPKVYRHEISKEILRSKLVGTVVRPRIVTDLAAQEGRAYDISQIFVGATNDANSKIAAAQEALSSGESFEVVAAQFSEGAEAKDGGHLGVFSESELSPEIFKAVSNLEPTQISDIVETSRGKHIFRLNAMSESQGRAQLSESDLMAEAEKYMTVDIYRNHVIDRKL